jgi:hypothetical protein
MHPLGWKMLREMGIPDRSLVEMLAESCRGRSDSGRTSWQE